MKSVIIKLTIALLLMIFIDNICAAQLLPPFKAKFIPISIHYTGRVTAEKKFLKHNHIVVSYYPMHGSTKIYQESFNDVAIKAGVFKLLLGKGKSKQKTKLTFDSFKQILSTQSSLKLAFTINQQKYFPYVIVQPAGHSPYSSQYFQTLNISSIERKYNNVSKNNAIQAVTLSKHKTKVHNTFKKKSKPFTLDMFGPKISQPLSVLAKITNKAANGVTTSEPKHTVVFDENGRRFGTQTVKQFDPLVDKTEEKTLPLSAPDVLMSFAGMGNIDGKLPPDIEGAVGPNHYVQQINLSTTIYNKDGSIAIAAFATNLLWSGFGGPCEDDNSGDAIALYDEQAQRWILSEFAINTGQSVCFAVSTSADPTGSYYLYELATQRLPDYFKLGVWPAANNNAYFMSTNTGAPGAYDVYALDRENMLLGNIARPAQFFQDYYNFLMPADSDGQAPDDNSPGYFYTFRDGGESYFTDATDTDSLDLFEFNVDWINPANSSFTRVQEITVNDGLAEFNWTVCGFFRNNCLPQPGGLKLDSHSWWPMQRFQYRKMAAKQTLLGTWTVNVEIPPAIRAAPRWFELNKTNGNWSIVQQGTFSPDAEHRFLPSIAMDAAGGIGMVYSKVSDSTFASIYYTAHGKDDVAGSMRTEKPLIQGTGVQTSALRRWGDYASMEVDPVDQCTFWMTSEYIPITGDRPWHTQIGTFRLPDCQFISVANSEQNICSMTDTLVTYGLDLSPGYATSTNLFVSDCPTGALCNFSSTPVIQPNTTSSLNISNTIGLAAGSHLLNVLSSEGNSSNLHQEAALILNTFDALPGKPVLVTPSLASLTFDAPQLSWLNASQSQSSLIEIDDDPEFNSIDVSIQTHNNFFKSPVLNLGQCYFWRVTENNICGSGLSSNKGFFYTNLIQNHTQINSSDVPKNIISTAPNTVTSVLMVSDVGTIADVNLNNFTGTHTWLADLTMTLTAPSGTTVELMKNSCDDNDDWDINFDDDVAFGPWPCPATDAGTYHPANPLSVFDGENADGEWTLSVIDGFNGDGGSLESWGLTFQSSIDPGIQVCDLFVDGFE